MWVSYSLNIHSVVQNLVTIFQIVSSKTGDGSPTQASVVSLHNTCVIKSKCNINICLITNLLQHKLACLYLLHSSWKSLYVHSCQLAIKDCCLSGNYCFIGHLGAGAHYFLLFYS